MQTFIATLGIFAAVTGLMAVGVIFSNRALRGSCGGTGQTCVCDRKTRRDCPNREPNTD